jgi:hypothetical protein
MYVYIYMYLYIRINHREPPKIHPKLQEILLRSTVPEKALENAVVTGGRLNARRALALAAIYPAPRPPIHAPSHLTFVDTNPAVGRIGAEHIWKCLGWGKLSEN